MTTPCASTPWRAAGVLGGPALDVVRTAVDDRANSRARRGDAHPGRRLRRGRARGAAHLQVDAARGRQGRARGGCVIGVGDLQGAGEAGARLLGEALGQRSGVAANGGGARAGPPGRAYEPTERALPHLERAVRDPSYDVRNAAIPGAGPWRSRAGNPPKSSGARWWRIGGRQRPGAWESPWEALVIKARGGARPSRTPSPTRSPPFRRRPQAEAARQALRHAARSGPPLAARLAARSGRAFLENRSRPTCTASSSGSSAADAAAVDWSSVCLGGLAPGADRALTARRRTARAAPCKKFSPPCA